MTYLINTITDKPEWDRKVFDEEIVNRWRNEALFPDTGNFSEKMFDYVSFATSAIFPIPQYLNSESRS